LRRRLEHRIAMHYRTALREARPLFTLAVPRWLLAQRAAWERWERRHPRNGQGAGDGAKPDLMHGGPPSQMPE
jgi:hypothetical protein